MKKFAPLLLLFLFIVLAWEAMAGSSGMSIDIDGEHLDGPLGTLFGVLFAGAGLIIGALVLLGVGVLLAVLFAGLGMLAVGALALLLLFVGLLASPLLLPLACVLAIVWYLARRDGQQRRQPAQDGAAHDAVKPL
ncbi:hypothetical protein INH39_15015 [Massilia violaceinigra]|uniref:Uncharacterized protein n=1 Tax=Massilia violaceinigra TaxID=2045208 RepID=A0ABY4ADM2_9BURK|nr:hypothetical protein [Massilia violaceinigra]UOD32851.1 hypothetical protein INH39_15015 [Massilia violaceinigra]